MGRRVGAETRGGQGGCHQAVAPRGREEALTAACEFAGCSHGLGAQEVGAGRAPPGPSRVRVRCPVGFRTLGLK